MKYVLYYLIAAFVIGIDQITKWLVVHHLSLYETIPIIGNFASITSIRNRGAAFSILQNQRLFFIVITLVVAAAVVWYLQKVIQQNRRLMPFALSLLLGGALGNFIDRLFYGRVVDFIQLHFQFQLFAWHVNYIFPIFNVADSAIDIGVALIFIDSLRSAKKEQKGQT